MTTLKTYKKSNLLSEYKDKLNEIYIFSINYADYCCIDKNNDKELKKIYNLAKSKQVMISEHNMNRINLKIDIDGYVADDDKLKDIASEIIQKIIVGIKNRYKIDIVDDEIYYEYTKPDPTKTSDNKIKHSMHITLNSDICYWRSKTDIKNFLESINIFSDYKHMVDPLIYNDIGLRVPYSYKCIKTSGNKKYIDTTRGGMMPQHCIIKDPYELFKKCLMCKITDNPGAVELTFDKKLNKKIDIVNIINNVDNVDNVDMDMDDQYTSNDIEYLLSILNKSRCENYAEWINVGMCLKNINIQYCLLWDKWSQQSAKYVDGDCYKRWKAFKRDKNGLKIGSLLMWAKTDNKIKYNDFMQNKKMTNMIISKYPNDKLIIGDRQVLTNNNCYINLKNKECLIKGAEHKGMANSMYVDIIDKYLIIKCKHPECHGKIYPCNHIIMNQNEMNVVFNGDINITINNAPYDDLIDFQQIDIYDDNILNKLVYNGLSNQSSQLADIIYYFYSNDYMYGEDNQWYMYADHKWNNVGAKNMELRGVIQTKLTHIYEKLYAYYKNNAGDEKKLCSIKKLINGFGNTKLKNDIIIELINLYTINCNPKHNFTQMLDTNFNLLGFSNGVYDLEKFEFRDGQRTDYISQSVGYEYINKHTDKYNELLQFLEDIQPNKAEREYMLTYLSIGLVGNLLELFTIFTGSGRNGKSKLVDLIKLTFGNYRGTVSSTLFTRKRPDANSPDPGLLNLLNKRIVTTSEPEKQEKLNSGFIKFLTGRDSTTLRNCHSNEIVEFKSRFMVLFICNDIPECDDMDTAFSKRLRCINFPTEFVDNPINQNQKKINERIDENFNYWKLDFMLLLIEYYKKYTITRELKLTPNILKWTDQYKEDTDLYLQFLNECTEEAETHIKTTDLYEAFKCWFRLNNPNTTIPNNKIFVPNIKKYKIIGPVKINNKGCKGIKNLKITDNE